jgi:hypothetical protein
VTAWVAIQDTRTSADLRDVGCARRVARLSLTQSDGVGPVHLRHSPIVANHRDQHAMLVRMSGGRDRISFARAGAGMGSPPAITVAQPIRDWIFDI